MTREEQLLSMGFEKNEDQQTYSLFIYDSPFHVDFSDVFKRSDAAWNKLMENIKNDTVVDKRKAAVKKSLMCYGITPLLIILAEKEKEQDFELCQHILDVINDMNIGLETKYTKDTLPNMIQSFNELSLSGETALQNMDYYVNKVREIIDGN